MGYQQRAISESAYEYQKRVESEEQVVVGVNRFAGEDTQPVDILHVDPSIAHTQVERLRDLKRRRDDGAVRATLRDLETAARGSDNLLEPMIGCLENNCTLGEISDTLRSVFGVYRELVEL